MNLAQARNHAFWYQLILKISDESDGYIPLREDISRRNDVMNAIKDVVLDHEEFTDQYEEILYIIRNYDCASNSVVKMYFPDL